MAVGDDELRFSVGAREIYDGVTSLTAEVRAMREDHASEKRDRERRDADVDERIDDVETRLVDVEAVNAGPKLDRLDGRVDDLRRAVWQARGAVALGVVAVGWLIETKVIGK